jgi:polyphosphate glucokinase
MVTKRSTQPTQTTANIGKRVVKKPTTAKSIVAKSIVAKSTAKKTTSKRTAAKRTTAKRTTGVKRLNVSKPTLNRNSSVTQKTAEKEIGVRSANSVKTAATKRTPVRATIKSKTSNSKVSNEISTLTFDIGGTGLKASLVSNDGKLLHERIRVLTPYPCYPDVLVEQLIQLANKLPQASRVAVGFPGVVRNGTILTAPNLSLPKGPGKSKKPSKKIAQMYNGYNLKKVLEAKLKIEVHVVNDADLAGAGAIKGHGLEVVATLGTGFGTGMFLNGKLLPHLEIAHLHFKNNKSFDEIIGDAARKSIGIKKWSKLVLEAIDTLYNLTHFDHLYLGGGNASRLTVKLPANVSTIPNLAAIKGGPKLFEVI